MNKILLTLILFLVLFIVGCGPGTPEQQARSSYEYKQRYDAEMEKIEKEGLTQENENNSSPIWFIPCMMILLGFLAGTLFSDLYHKNNKNQNVELTATKIEK